MSEQSERRYTTSDLLDAARAQGTPSTARRIVDWVHVGLLDHPQRRGLGRGKGTSSTWPENQHQLFLLLLRRRPEVKRIKALCNIPVSLWLYFGPEYVPLEQAERAMFTYADRATVTSARVARATAKRVVAHLIGPDTRRADTTALIDAVVLATGGGRFQRDPLLQAAGAVFDREQVGRTLGPPGARLTAAAWVNIVEANFTAIDAIDPPDDERFEAARLTQLGTQQQYIENHPQLGQDPDIGSLFETPTAEFLMHNACWHLMTTLGFLELAHRRAKDQEDAA